MASWSDLTSDLINSIGESLDSYADFVRLRAVCTSWRSALPNCPTQPLAPWLMLPFDEVNDTHCAFFSVVDRKIYNLDLPRPQEKLFLGFFNGWIITQDRSSLAFYLFNPFTRVQIDLPSLNTFPEAYDPPSKFPRSLIGDNKKIVPAKVMLTKDDDADGYNAMAVHFSHSTLYFCQGGDIERVAITAEGNYSAITFDENKFYSGGGKFKAGEAGHIAVSYLNSLTNFVEIPVKLPNKIPQVQQVHLISCDLGLLLIVTWRQHRDDDQTTREFEVYRVETNSHELIKINSLGDYMLFLGSNTSFAIPCRSRGLKGNCIYFLDYNIVDYNIDDDEWRRRGSHVFGVFNMEGEKASGQKGYLDLLSFSPEGGDKLFYLPEYFGLSSPIWVVPNVLSSTRGV